MKRIIANTYENLSCEAADIIAEQLRVKPDSVLGLATGGTPLGLYSELIKRFNAGEVDFSRARSFNLDEYYPIKKDHPQSYNYYMHENLFGKVNLSSTRVLDGETDDPEAECRRYDSEIEAAGGIDLQILGIGLNGHIGFNEPSAEYSIATHLTVLTESTLTANSRFFQNPAEQPDRAITMGFGAIFAAKKIILLISGSQKAPIAEKLFSGKLFTDVPAAILTLHPDVTVILDKDAAALLS